MLFKTTKGRKILNCVLGNLKNIDLNGIEGRVIMPRGNGTGPAGMGPMTGRAAGYCAGYPVPGYMNPYGGRLGLGYGFSYPRASYPVPYGGYMPYRSYPMWGPQGYFRYGRGRGRRWRRW